MSRYDGEPLISMPIRAVSAIDIHRFQLATAIGLISLATLLGIVAAGDNVLAADISIARRVQVWQGAIPENLQRVGDLVGSTAGALTALSVCLLITVIARWRIDAAFVVAAATFRLGALFLKGIFDSPRPTDDLVMILRHYHSTGYPSGHSMTTAMVAATVTIVVWRHTEAVLWRRLVLAIGALLTLLVGWSRIWAGAHWPSDVLGGWMYGAGFVLLAAWIVYREKSS